MHRLTRTGDNARRLRRRRQTPLDEAIELGQTLASRHPWVDLDDLEYDDDFTRLVELLGDAEQIDDDAFAEAALRGSKFLRAAAMVAIADGREPPPGWLEGVPWSHLAGAGVLLLAISLIAWRMTTGAPSDRVYLPPRFEDGRVVPGTTVER